MPIQQCPIEIPEGWEFVGFRPAKSKDYIFTGGKPHRIATSSATSLVIIRRARPAIEVGDWVRVVHLGSRTDGKRGVVHDCPSGVPESYLVSIKGIGELFYQRDNLIKQTRTVKPYTLDQCIAEIAIRESRGVVISGGAYTITRIGTNGAHIGDMFYVYDRASKLITWPNGDAFGIVTWEDAE